MGILGTVDLLPDYTAPFSTVICVVDQIDHGKAAVFISESGNSGVREGVAHNHGGKGSLLNSHIQEGVRQQLYSAQMLLAGAAARHMVKSGIHGGILFITSIHGQMITTNDFLYGGMKAAIERSCKSLALELSPYRIRVNCIAPGAINVRHQDDAQHKYPYFTMVPLGRWGVEADIGRAAAFLLSDEADYITGETLRVDGGFALPGVPEGWAEPHPVDTRFVQAAYEQMLKNEEETDNG